MLTPLPEVPPTPGSDASSSLLPLLPLAPVAPAVPDGAVAAPRPVTPGITVRRGGLVDVNAVVRMLTAGNRHIDIDGDGEPDGPLDPEAAGSAARMALSHVVLDRGDLWVAHDVAGDLQAISVWMPGDVEGVAAELRQVLERELGTTDPGEAIGPSPHVRPQLMGAMQAVLEQALVLQPRLVLFAVTVAPQVDPAAVVELARAVVAPVVSGDGDVLAVALDGDRARLLEAVGFAEVAQVPLGADHALWLGRA
ncbi:hypothetical protein [Litorihabitans aurantiacus]|uniref:Uncharacterized protein n=1 Tax=Litorihabitans aurantiacus TaxID=1930061 RepID=A0AA37XIQ3_9MICO|nr:hypothetical protein [Litorihabitans aurantiacus]GMA33275.1 hypothetical protein GCM10025875_32670 [Litorihabitans aurantiacus]